MDQTEMDGAEPQPPQPVEAAVAAEPASAQVAPAESTTPAAVPSAELPQSVPQTVESSPVANPIATPDEAPQQAAKRDVEEPTEPQVRPASGQRPTASNSVLKRLPAFLPLPTETNHQVRLSIQLDYLLDKEATPGSPEIQREASKTKHTRGRPGAVAAAEGDKHQYYVSYNLTSQVQGKTQVLCYDNSVYSTMHEVEVNEDLLAELYSKPIEFCLWEIVPEHDFESAPAPVAAATPGRANARAAVASSVAPLVASSLDEREPEAADRGGVSGGASLPRDVLRQMHTLARPESSKRVTFGARRERAANVATPNDNETEVTETGLNAQQASASEKPAKVRSPPASNEVAPEETPKSAEARRVKTPSQQSGNVPTKDLPRTRPHPHHYQSPQRTVEESLGLPRNSIADNDAAMFASGGSIADGPHPGDYAPRSRSHSRASSMQSLRGSSATARANGHRRSASSDAQRSQAQLTSAGADATGDAAAAETPSQPTSAAAKRRQPRGKRTASRGSAAVASRPESPYLSLKELRQHNTVHVRPKTPPQPHHHNAYEKTVHPVAANKKTLQRGKRGNDRAQRQVLVGKIVVDPTGLFFGELIVGSDLGGDVDGVQLLSAQVSLSEALLSTEQRNLLNPMAISIDTICGLPSAPTPFATLDRLCEPVTTIVSYFGDRNRLVATARQRRRSTVVVGARHLVLAGLLERQTLREKLLHEPLRVEIHDRSLLEAADQPASEGQLSSACPYGVAQFSLAPLALGAKRLTLTSSIFPCAARPSQRWAIPPALWLESMSTLRIQITFHLPLDGPRPTPAELGYELHAHESLTIAPATLGVSSGLSRIVVVVSQRALMLKLQLLVARLNYAALFAGAPDGRSDAEVFELVTTNSLNAQQRASALLDYISGYCVYDGRTATFMLEGLRSGALGRVLDLLRAVGDSSAFRLVDVPSLVFAERMWPALYSNLTHVQLRQPIGEIMKQRHVYMRKTTGQSLFGALSALLLFQTLPFFSPATFQAHLPSNATMQLLAETYGVRLTSVDQMWALFGANQPAVLQAALAHLASVFPGLGFGSAEPLGALEALGDATATVTVRSLDASADTRADADPLHHVRRLYAAMQLPGFGARHRTLTYNDAFIRDLEEQRRSVPKDLIERNRQLVALCMNKTPSDARLESALPRIAYPRERSYGDQPVYNYSMQSLCADRAQRAAIRSKVVSDAGHLYLIGRGGFLAETVSPVDYDEVLRTERHAAMHPSPGRPAFKLSGRGEH